VAGVPSIEQQTSAGTEQPPPATGPAGAKGKNVWFVSCGQSVPDCSEPAAAAGAAAQALGWQFHIADGKLNVGGGELAAVETAVAAKPDAIIIHGAACSESKPALEKAKAQGIKVIGIEAPDCSTNPADRLFTVPMVYTTTAPNTPAYFIDWGRRAADYIIAASNGKAQIINNASTSEPVFQLINEGFVSEMKKCPGCKILYTVNFVQSDQVPNGPWIQRFRAALVRYPAATYAHVPSAALVSSLGGAVAAKNANPKLVVVGGSGTAPAMDLVRQGYNVVITSAHSAKWMGWGAVDELNRAFNSQSSVAEGVGFRAVNKSDLGAKNQTSGQSYESNINWQDAYTKTWSGK
jgi:ribose transport system substrate-binding protein